MTSAKIAEIFTSLQGEGRYVGKKQIFVRFSGCNLNCTYCDTLHQNGKEYTPYELIKKIDKNDLQTAHSLSLTGGEPLLHADFINELADKTNLALYLETNATLPHELKKVIKNIDIVAADIKLDSCTKQGDKFDLHKNFFKITKENNTETFLKIVYDQNITEEEIEKSIKLASDFDYEIFLQPKMTETDFAFSLEKALDIFEKYNCRYKQVRFLPQMHKFWNVK